MLIAGVCVLLCLGIALRKALKMCFWQIKVSDGAQSACDAASASFSLENDVELGSTGQLKSQLVLPDGATASLALTAIESTVTAGTGLANGWSGISTLPATGEWSATMTVTI